MNDTIADLRALLEEDPSSREFYKLGEALRRDGELDEAAEVLRGGLNHHPRYVAAWVALARLELERGNLDQVEAAAAQALDVDSENAVAARLIGEAASRRGDWKRALSAWRLALALTPGDTELNERVEEAEEQLASDVPEQPPFDTEQPPGDEIYADEEESQVPTALPELPELPREVFAFEDAGDPFTVTPRGDTDVWKTGEDVFSFGAETMAEEPAPSGGPFGPAEPERVEAEAAAVVLPEDQVAEDFEPVVAAEEASEPVGVEPAPSEVEPRSDVDTPPAGMPLPTVTLAKLALDQGDLDLARRTLEQVVTLRGPSEETRELEGLLEAAARGGGGDTKTSRKIARLQGWMRAVRLAAESQRHGV